MWKAEIPFNDLAAPPANELETRPVLKATTKARASLAAMNQAVLRIPNPGVLISSLPLLEAQASSEIENIVTTTDDLFRLAAGSEVHASSDTKETLRYREALFAGLQSIEIRPLTTRTALEVCTNIKGRDMEVRALPGTYIGNPVTGKARYTPPEGPERIKEKLGEWERFIHENPDIDPLIIMSAAHYQFQAIHPFSDGNGRTGRILNILLLVEAELLREPVLYLSRYIIRHKDEYYTRLLAVTKDNDWEGWLLYMLKGIEVTADETLQLIDSIQELQLVMREELRIKSAAGPNAELLDLLFEKPYCRINDVVSRCGISRPTATKWLNDFSSNQRLTQIKIGREWLFINHRFIELLAS